MITYDGFLATVQETAEIPRDEAERASCATLRTLSERISSGEAEDLAERLPGELRSCVDTDHRPDLFARDEFLGRVADRARIGATAAERDARAVLTALWRAVGPDEFADMRSQLPKDFDPLLDDALRAAPSAALDAPVPAEAVSADAFLSRVAERAGIDRERAEQAADAVLEELAIRITVGQVDDLERRLPRELRPPLERGVARSRAARPLALDTFLTDIARREGVDRSAATEHARAVLTTLRQAIGEREWTDTTAQLPDEYRQLWRVG
ncbi:MAG: hypothetical protein JWQ20_1065 [Conexibacter sp.]|nr:hypothetical protein [Conexibacter sp.]